MALTAPGRHGFGPGSGRMLTRSVAFLSRLLEAGVEVRFCDMPDLGGIQGRLVLNIMVAVAERRKPA